MRFLLPLLLITAPLLAQEPGAEERRAEEERRAKDELELAAEKAAYEKRAVELKRQAEQRSKWGKSAEEVARLLEELRSSTEATRAQAMEELKSVNATLEELLPILAEAMRASEEVRSALVEVKAALPNTIVVGALGGPGGGEAITGSADGTDYTLKSLGDGKYELNAQKKDADGRLMEKWVEQGTLAELREKHAFLKGALAVQWPAPALQALRGRVALDPAVRVWQAAAPAGLLGANGQFAAAWDGGGRVGVSVLKPSEDLRFHLQLPEGAGFIVQQVVPGSRAEQVGIRRMDVLLKLDGELIDSPIQLKKLHEKTGVLEILRRSEAKKIDLSAFPEWQAPETLPVDVAVATPTAPAGAR